MNQINKNTHRRLCGIFIALLMTAIQWTATAVELDVPYVQTPPDIIPVMLDMAKVTADDYVIDLGTGDGRIVIAAVQRGATGLGIDLDPERITEARAAAEAAGVSDRVKFEVQDLFETDLSAATVVTLFLNSEVNMRLRPTLLEKLKPGTRVVSHNFDMKDWQPDDYTQLMMNSNNNFYMHDVYLWIVPANAGGTWEGQAGDKPFHMTVSQQFQHIKVEARLEGESLLIDKPVLQGDEISFVALPQSGGRKFTFMGRMDTDTISGTLQSSDVAGDQTWTAKRGH